MTVLLVLVKPLLIVLLVPNPSNISKILDVLLVLLIVKNVKDLHVPFVKIITHSTKTILNV